MHMFKKTEDEKIENNHTQSGDIAHLMIGNQQNSFQIANVLSKVKDTQRTQKTTERTEIRDNNSKEREFGGDDVIFQQESRNNHVFSQQSKVRFKDNEFGINKNQKKDQMRI